MTYGQLFMILNPNVKVVENGTCVWIYFDSANHDTLRVEWWNKEIPDEALKAQEPVKPYIDYDGQDVWRCGSCCATLFHLSHTQADENEQNCVKFCRYCGRAVKWDEPPKEGT